MAEPRLLQLAQDLEWLGCELEHIGHQHAMLGFPEAGPSWDTFCEKRRGMQMTADKIEHELKNAVRYNPTGLMGVEFPLDETLDSIADLLGEVEEIKHCSVFAVGGNSIQGSNIYQVDREISSGHGKKAGVNTKIMKLTYPRLRLLNNGLHIELSEKAPGDFE